MDTGRHDPQLACFSLAEDVSLLSLSGRWPTKAGASANINSGPRPRSRRWSKVIYEAYPDICGLLYASSMNGNRSAVTLYERTARALPKPRTSTGRSLTWPRSFRSKGSPPTPATISSDPRVVMRLALFLVDSRSVHNRCWAPFLCLLRGSNRLTRQGLRTD